MAETVVISTTSPNNVTVGPVEINQVSVSSPAVTTVSAIIFQGPKGDTGATGSGSNLTGEVTSTAESVSTISSNVVDEDNLKVSNSPVNGYLLSAQSGNTGGLTWVEAPSGNTNLGIGSASETQVEVTSSTGSNATIAAASTSQAGVMTKALFDKLGGVESGATADQTASEIRSLVNSASDSNVFTDADHTKLNGIEDSATADQTESEIRSLVESASDSNVFTDDDHTKLNGIESGATADQTASEIKTLVESASDSNVFTDADHTKLNGIAISATANDTDANLKARANHTGTQDASTIADFDTEVSNNSSVATNTAKVSSKVNVTSAQPTSAADFTIGGVDYELLFDESATSSQAFLYGLNSGSTAIYRATMSRSTILTLDVTGFVLQDSSGSTVSTGTTYEIGATTNIFKENCQGFNANYNNVAGGTLSGTNTISVSNRSSSQGWGSSALTIETSDLTAGTPQTLVDFRDGTSQADFDVYYPNDTSWDSSQRKTLQFSLTANDGTTQDTSSATFYFKNRVFHGGSSNSSLTSSQIIGLSNSPFTGSNFSLSETSVTTSGTQYYYYCYPSRLSGSPTFKIGPNPTDFTPLSDVSVTNSSGYVETYKVFQSPEQYTNASFTLTVET